ncbi:hypothetical protein ScPMuIL_015420 [Solemya velum]
MDKNDVKSMLTHMLQISSGLHQKLAAGSLTFAKAYSTAYNAVDKLEQELDAEIERDNRDSAQSKFAVFRQTGKKLIHSKHVLLCIVLLNIVDCVLVLGELILDLHHVKDTLDDTEEKALSFLNKLNVKYPGRFGFTKISQIEAAYELVLEAALTWGDDCISKTSSNFSNFNGQLWNLTSINFSAVTNITDSPNVRRRRAADGGSAPGIENVEHSIEEDIAHAFHKASITILGILVILTILKILFFGRQFFTKKLEVFDSAVITASFIVDLAFLKGMTMYSLQDLVFILAFMLPWRVIRVVNSLVVAVMDHEHFRLKLLYTQKKKIDNESKSLKKEKEIYSNQVSGLKNLCMREGLAEWKVERTLARIPAKPSKGIMGSLSSLAFSTFGTSHKPLNHTLASNGPHGLRKGKSAEFDLDSCLKDHVRSQGKKSDSSHLWSALCIPGIDQKVNCLGISETSNCAESEPDIFATTESKSGSRLKYRSHDCSVNFDTVSSEISIENDHKMWIGSDEENSSDTSNCVNGRTEASIVFSENDDSEGMTCNNSNTSHTEAYRVFSENEEPIRKKPGIRVSRTESDEVFCENEEYEETMCNMHSACISPTELYTGNDKKDEVTCSVNPDCVESNEKQDGECEKITINMNMNAGCKESKGMYPENGNSGGNTCNINTGREETREGDHEVLTHNDSIIRLESGNVFSVKGCNMTTPCKTTGDTTDITVPEHNTLGNCLDVSFL